MTAMGTGSSFAPGVGLKALPFFAMSFVVFLSAPAARAGELFAGDLTVTFRESYEADARTAIEVVPTISREISAALGLPAPSPLFIDFQDPGGFESTAGRARGEWALAIAFPAESRIVIRASRLDAANDLSTTLRHELVHLLIGLLEKRTGRRVPAWFHEGVAQFQCERLFFGSREDFLTAAAAGRLMNFSDLETSWPAEGREAHLAYAQAEDFVTFLEKNHPGAVRGILASMGEGKEFEAAFKETAGEDLESAQRRWIDGLREGPPLIVALLQDNPGLMWVLIFACGAVILVIAYIRHRFHRRAILDSMD